MSAVTQEALPEDALAVRGAARTQRRRERERRISLYSALAVLAIVMLWALWPGLFTQQNPLLGNPDESLLAPSLAHPFGTDQLGRDLFARVIHASSLSLIAALIAVAVAFVVGSTLGLLAGFLGGWVDDIVMRAADVMLAIPSILLSMALITVLGRGTAVIAMAVGIAGIASFSRTMRSEVLAVRVSDYVEASRAAGTRRWRTMVGHVLPNASSAVVVLAAIEFGTALLAIASLSFLGYGEPAPTPEWGALVSAGRDYMATSWWLITMPGIVVSVVVLSINRVARALRERTSTGRNGR